MSILVGIPTRGLISWGTVARLQEIRDQNPALAPIVFEQGHMSEGWTRNRLVERFLQTSHEIMVMVDDDIVPPLNMLDLANPITAGDADIVGCPMLLFNTELSPVPIAGVFRETDGTYVPLPKRDGLVYCDLCATGCIAIARHVFEAVPDGFAELLGNGNSASADVMFARRAKQAGFRIAADFRMVADHWTQVSLGAVLVGARQLAAAS